MALICEKRTTAGEENIFPIHYLDKSQQQQAQRHRKAILLQQEDLGLATSGSGSGQRTINPMHGIQAWNGGNL